MREVKKQKQPLQIGCRVFSTAEKMPPEMSLSIDDLLKRWEGSTSARLILQTAKKLNIGPDRFGNSNEEINENIGRASFKLSRRDRGYCKEIYAVASMIIAYNDMDTAKWLIREIASKMDENDVKKHLVNISDIMEEAKGLGLRTEQLGSIRTETTADEIIRVATNTKYRYPKNGLAIVMIGQKAPELKERIITSLVPKCSGTELFELKSYIMGRIGRRKMDIETGKELIKKIEERLDEVWMAPPRL